MDLIKQLGGYEKAKRELQLKEQNSIFQCCASVTAEMIRDALLEYRREHNIFEVGDKVVFKWVLESSDIFTIYSIDAYFIGVKRFEDDDFYYANINWGLKHATDEEIKAGHRL